MEEVAMNVSRQRLQALLLIINLLIPLYAWSETVVELLPSGKSVSADYRKGEKGKPAVLVLHGFLTTNGFSTVQVIVNDLADSGFTVLAPTLSLGINSRKASLPCDAIHTHTMESDVAEIDFWTRWLTAHGAHRIVMVGHSLGSLQLVTYVANHPDSAVKAVIATSLLNMQEYETAPMLAKDIHEAEKLQREKPVPLHSYRLVYCENYTATPDSFLSYVRWSPARVLSELKKRKVPVYAIMGGKDDRFGPAWIKQLRTTGIDVKVIDGANHFFDGGAEFDLLDAVRNHVTNNSLH